MVVQQWGPAHSPRLQSLLNKNWGQCQSCLLSAPVANHNFVRRKVSENAKAQEDEHTKRFFYTVEISLALSGA